MEFGRVGESVARESGRSALGCIKQAARPNQTTAIGKTSRVVCSASATSTIMVMIIIIVIIVVGCEVLD